MSRLRLDKLLANMGAGSRKEVKRLIRAGQVTIDGVCAKSGDITVDPEQQLISLNGVRIQYKPYVYLMMNKPSGVLSATEDSRTATAVDLVNMPFSGYDLSPAGRLDIDTEGFLLLTNDGAFIHAVITPKRHVVKEYYCIAEGLASDVHCKMFAEGIVLADGTECMPAELEIVQVNEAQNTSELFVRICEGKFHQVKRMLLACRMRVKYLKRTAIGGVSLDPALAPGEYRELTEDEMKLLRKETI